MFKFNIPKKRRYFLTGSHKKIRLCKGLRYVTPHSFRHLCASIMIESGASVKTVQACMGHSDANTTLNIYAHAFSKAQALASETVASAFKLQQAT